MGPEGKRGKNSDSFGGVKRRPTVTVPSDFRFSFGGFSVCEQFAFSVRPGNGECRATAESRAADAGYREAGRRFRLARSEHEFSSPVPLQRAFKGAPPYLIRKAFFLLFSELAILFSPRIIYYRFQSRSSFRWDFQFFSSRRRNWFSWTAKSCVKWPWIVEAEDWASLPCPTAARHCGGGGVRVTLIQLCIGCWSRRSRTRALSRPLFPSSFYGQIGMSNRAYRSLSDNTIFCKLFSC